MKGVTTMRTQILKINGITPKQLGLLHETIGSEETAMSAEKAGRKTTHLEIERGRSTCLVAHPEIIESKFDKEYGTYTVEIKVPISCKLAKTGPEEAVFAPLRILELIYESLDIYPRQEEIRKL